MTVDLIGIAVVYTSSVSHFEFPFLRFLRKIWFSLFWLLFISVSFFSYDYRRLVRFLCGRKRERTQKWFPSFLPSQRRRCPAGNNNRNCCSSPPFGEEPPGVEETFEKQKQKWATRIHRRATDRAVPIRRWITHGATVTLKPSAPEITECGSSNSSNYNNTTLTSQPVPAPWSMATTRPLTTNSSRNASSTNSSSRRNCRINSLSVSPGGWILKIQIIKIRRVIAPVFSCTTKFVGR